MSRWPALVAARNRDVASTGRWRTLRPLDGRGPTFVLPDGAQVVSFASNDYLGLSQHPAVRQAAVEAIARWGAGAGSARLIVGDRPVHHDLEGALATWKGTDTALLFPTGFAANLGVLSTLATSDTLVVSDERNHASIIDGCRLAKAEVAVTRHADVGHVAELLDGESRPAIVVTESVFSMDGDEGDLASLAGVCRSHEALLIVDEAHAVLGPTWVPPEGLDVLRVGTLSKTLGSLGGFVAGPRPFTDLLVNQARSFIFTTGPSPADAAAAQAALAVLRSAEGDALLARLRGHVDRIDPGRSAPIISVVVGDERAAVAASDDLLAHHGLLVPAIRPPTVAVGTSRLRITLSAAHSDDQVERLAKALAGL